MIACAFSSYTAAFVRYMKKHPSLRVKYERAAEQDDDDADSAENAENPENDWFFNSNTHFVFNNSCNIT